MSKKLLSLMIGAALSIAGVAQASPVWTITARGTITMGIDNVQLFGTGSTSLTGLAYTQTIVTSVDPSKHTIDASSNSWRTGLYQVDPQPFTASISVNGRTISYSIPRANYAYQFISAGLSGFPHNENPDQIYSSQDGIDARGYGVSAYLKLHTYDPARSFVPTNEFTQQITATFVDRVTTIQNFYVAHEGFYLTYIIGKVDSIAVNEGISDVPEPAPWALLVIGLAGAAGRRRRGLQSTAKD